MKKLAALCLAGALTLGLTACGTPQGTDPKVLEKPQHKLTVVGIDQLHQGRAWDVSPDGRTVLFGWDEGVAENDPGGERRPPTFLHTLNLATQAVTKISSSEDYHQGNAQYSPQGETIAFMENQGEYFRAYLMGSTGGSKVELVHTDNLLIAPPLAWAPTGNQVAVAASYPTRGGEIRIYDTQGNVKTTITGDPLRKPVFYDNDTLLYVTGQDSPQVVAHSLTGSPREVAPAFDFALSPNSQRLAFSSKPNDDGIATIRVSALDSDLTPGTTLTEVTVGYGSLLAWSPDSRFLVYTDGGNIWAVNPESGEKQQLVSNMQWVYNLFWASDKAIIFSGTPADGDGDTMYIYQIELEG